MPSRLNWTTSLLPSSLSTALRTAVSAPMLLHVADIHARFDWLEWISSRATELGCTVAIAGDLLLDTHDREPQIRKVVEWVRSAKFPLLISSGNHDLDPGHGFPLWMRKLRQHGVPVDGSRIKVEGISTALVPFGTPVRMQRFGCHSHAEILLHHEPPFGSAIADGRESGAWAGSSDLRSYLEHPKCPARLVLCGHVHTAGAWHDRVGSALCLNPGYNPKTKTPRHILIDLAARTAQLNSCGKLVNF